MRDVRSKVDKWGENEKDRIAFSTNGKQLAVQASQRREKFSLHISYRRIPLAQEKYHSLHMFRQQWSMSKVVWIAVCLCVDMLSIKSLAWMQSLHAIGYLYVCCMFAWKFWYVNWVCRQLCGLIAYKIWSWTRTVL